MNTADFEPDTSENPNVVGGLDRLVVWAGLAILAVLPTLFTVICTPWRAAPLLGGERPEGREGYVLGPGVFFVAAVIGAVLLSTMIDSADPDEPTNPATIEETFEEERSASSPFALGYELGQRAGERAEERAEENGETVLSDRLIAGLTSGNVWLAAGSLSPYFFMACLIAAFTGVAGRLCNVPAWNIRAAMGGGLYFVTSAMVLFTLLSEAADLIGFEASQLSSGTGLFFGLILLSPTLLLPWQTFWFVKRYTGASSHSSGLVTITTVGFAIVAFVIYSIVILFTLMNDIEELDASPTETVIEESLPEAEAPGPAVKPIPPSSPSP